jgi:hypothetical protein
MAYQLELDPDTGIARITVEGGYTMEEFFAEIPGTWSQPGYKSHPRLWDFRRADLGFTTEEMRRLARFVLRGRGSDAHRTAYLVGSELQFGMARMFESLTHGSGVERGVFRDPAAAVAWLLETSS